MITIFRGDYMIVLFKSNHVIAKFRGDHVIAIDLPGCGMSSWLPKGMMYHDLEILGKLNHSLKGVFAKNERGYRLNAIKSAFDRYESYFYLLCL